MTAISASVDESDGKRHMSGTRLVAIGDRRINPLSHGRGEPRFTCPHGLVDTLEIWKRLAAALETRGRVARIDQRAVTAHRKRRLAR